MLDHDVHRSLQDIHTPSATYSKLYYWLTLTKELDQRAVQLHGQGLISTFPSSAGQEALFVGTGFAMDYDDIYIPYYRDHGAMVQRDVSLDAILSYWGGLQLPAECGYGHDYPFCVPIASQTTHAVGAAFTLHYRKDAAIVVCSLGDGATSKGDFYEALNYCCLHGLPVLFNINVNKWAISTPIAQQTCNLYDKLSGFDCDIVQLESHDIISVIDSVTQAKQSILQNARPYIILHHTHRLSPHTTSDDATRYIDPATLAHQKVHFDPIHCFRNILQDAYGYSDESLEDIEALACFDVAKAVDRFKTKVENVTDLKEFVYASDS